MNETKELRKRMEILHRNHYIWLIQSATNITRSREEAEDLVGDLMVYLIEKGNPTIYYKDSFNLMYCYRFLQTRWVNKINKKNKLKVDELTYRMDIEDEVYPMEQDQKIMETFDEVQKELERLTKTRMWPKAKLFQLYYTNDDTMIAVAEKIGISKSTTFISIKKIREHLKSIIQNPFIDA